MFFLNEYLAQRVPRVGLYVLLVACMRDVHMYTSLVPSLPIPSISMLYTEILKDQGA